MDKEYQKNQKYQRKSFKKYRKYIGRILLWAGIGVASAFIIPYGSLFTLLKGVIGEYMAGSATFIAQWGLAALGLGGTIVNAFKANREKNKIDNAQDEEENIIDGMINENDELKKKVENLEKTKSKTLEENINVKSMDDKEKNFNVNTITQEDNKEKKFVK